VIGLDLKLFQTSELNFQQRRDLEKNNNNGRFSFKKGADGVVYIVVLSPPATEETGVMSREIKSRQDIHRVVALRKKKQPSEADFKQ
jgi:hypothetical protein